MDKQGQSLEGIRVLTKLGKLSVQRSVVDDALHHEVQRARAAGCSWRMVGVALGVSAQSAWERYNGHQHRVFSYVMAQDELPID